MRMKAYSMKARWRTVVASAVLSLFQAAASHVCAQANQIIYDDALENNWQNWSYSVTANFANTSPVHSGSDSISATITGAYGGVQIINPSGLNSTPYTNITFWLN